MKFAEKLAEYFLHTGIAEFSFDKPFVWSSGIKAPIYVDTRQIISFPILRNLIVEEYVEIVKQNFAYVDFIAAVATGGIPLGAILADRLHLPLIYVRSKAKEYGKSRDVEGRVLTGANVIVVEDVISTGKSVFNVVEKLKGLRLNVLGVFALYAHKKQLIEKLFGSLEGFYFLTEFEILAKRALELGYINENQYDILLEWHNNLNFELL